MSDAVNVIQQGLQMEKKYIQNFGENWEQCFNNDLIDFCVNVIRLQKDITYDDEKLIKEILNLDYCEIKENVKMSKKEMTKYISSDAPNSFKLLTKTVSISEQKNNVFCNLYLTVISLIGAYIFECIDQSISLEAIQVFAKYIKHLDEYMKLTIPEEFLTSEEDVKIYITINGKSFDEIFDENCELRNENEFENILNPKSQIDETYDCEENSDVNDYKDDLKKLEELVGLDEVKKQVNILVNLALVDKERKKRNLKSIPMSQHLVFIGNPGTGKTTVARLLGSIYRDIGILSKGHVVEVDRSELIGGYIGQTAIKTQEVIDSAIGGVLFIDEAYSITNSDSPNDFGSEAIAVLLKEMEDKRDDLVVIVAGYPKEMEKFINSNPGLKSRFKKTIEFKDYNAEELLQVFKKMCDDNGYKLGSGVNEKLIDIFQKEIDSNKINFANARYARNIFEKAVENQANRIIHNGEIHSDELIMFNVEDLD